MATNSVNLQQAFMVKNIKDNTAVSSSLIEKQVQKILQAKIPAVHAGFLKMQAADTSGNVRIAQAIKAQIRSYSASNTPDHLQVTDQIYSFGDPQQILTSDESLNKLLWKNATELNGEVLAAQTIQIFMYEAACMWDELIAWAKSKKWENALGPNTINWSNYNPSVKVQISDLVNTSNFPKCIGIEKIDEALIAIRYLLDPATSYIPADLIKVFVSPQYYQSIKHNLAALGHNIKTLEGFADAGFVTDGVAIYVDPLLGQKFEAKVLHKTKVIDLTGINVIIATLGSFERSVAGMEVYSNKNPNSNNANNGIKWAHGQLNVNWAIRRLKFLVETDVWTKPVSK